MYIYIATRGPALTSSPPCPSRAQPFADRVDQSLRAAGETLDEVDAEISEFRAHMRSAVVIYASQQDELRGSARAALARARRRSASPSGGLPPLSASSARGRARALARRMMRELSELLAADTATRMIDASKSA